MKVKVIVLDFEVTRIENDERLLPEIDNIRSATDIETLVPFAKAYLGMFYVIDSELPAKEKIALLANRELADAILQGFVASLSHTDFPDINEIGTAAAVKNEFSQGYVLLAGLDLIAQKSTKDIVDLKGNVLESAIAFYYSNQNSHQHIWFDFLLKEHKNIVTAALGKYWIAMLKNGAVFLPGRHFIFSATADADIIQSTILPLLKYWKKCKAKTLLPLLLLAIQYSEADELSALCDTTLSEDDGLNEKTRLYWIMTAYLLAPDKYYATLTNYVGRVKMKILPLLDFTVLLILNNNKLKNKLSAKTVVQLIRLISPVFPPQQHVYGALGGLDINSRNVMTMFYFLLGTNDKNVIDEIKALKKARVMKIYAAVIDNLLKLHEQKKNDTTFETPEFNVYIDNLVANNMLEGRSNKFDIR